MLLAASRGNEAPSTLRDWQIETSIKRWHFGDATEPHNYPTDTDQLVTFSADRRYFFFIRSWGDIDKDVRVSRLSVFASSEVADAIRAGDQPKALRELDFSSGNARPGRAPLRMVRWRKTTGELEFVHTPDELSAIVYRLNVLDGNLHKLATTEREIEEYHSAGEGVIVVNRMVEIPSEPDYPCVEAELNEKGRMPDKARLMPQELWYAFAGAPLRKMEAVRGARYLRSGGLFAISPRGDRAILVRQADGNSQQRWLHYPHINPVSSEYAYFDLKTGGFRSVVGSPLGEAAHAGRLRNRSGILELGSNVFWEAGGRSAILVNTGYDQMPGAERRPSEPNAYILSVDGEGRVDGLCEPVLKPDGVRISAVRWATEGKTVELARQGRDGQVVASLYFSYRDGLWIEDSQPASQVERTIEANELVVRAEASINDETRIVGSIGSNSAFLTSFDPALQGVWLTRQQTFQWKEGDKPIQGGLWLPRNASGPVPLVVQTYGWTSTSFLPDGPNPGSPDCAQVLAARGIAVLQLPVDAPLHDWEVEGEAFKSRVDAAVSQLVERGLVDVNRLGITGFSRTGFRVFYLLTHPGKFRYQAAVCADATTGGYPEQLYDHGLGDGFFFGVPFWQDRSKWLRAETTFNVDQITTPTLFTENDRQPFSQLVLQKIGAFAANKKPVELVYFPTGAHQLQRPRERAELIRVVAEWMSFWLKDDVPQDPKRAARWAVLRKQQVEVLKTPPPPRGKWVFQPDAEQPAWTPPPEQNAAGVGTEAKRN